jgi:hypothetical protein
MAEQMRLRYVNAPEKVDCEPLDRRVVGQGAAERLHGCSGAGRDGYCGFPWMTCVGALEQVRHPKAGGLSHGLDGATRETVQKCPAVAAHRDTEAIFAIRMSRA